MKKLTMVLLLFLSCLSISILTTQAESVQTDVDGYDYYQKLDIIDVEAGFYSSIMLTRDGRVFTWGRNNHGQLGDGTVVDKTTPVEITDSFGLAAGDKIVAIEAGDFNGMVLSDFGRVFIWGDNLYGQIGNGGTTDILSPVEVTITLSPEETIIDLALGGRNAGVVTSDNRVFIWGEGAYGVIGNLSYTDRLSPTDVTSHFTLAESEVIEEIDLGVKNGIALSNLGIIYGWGNDEDQAVGASGSGPYLEPVSLMNMFLFNQGESVEYINATLYNTTIITTEGRMYKCGSNIYNSVMIHTNDSLPWIEENLEMPLNPGEYIIFENGGYSSLAYTNQDRMFSWGYNSVGQLANGNVSSYYVYDTSNDVPVQNGEKVIDIASGFVHTVFLTDQGRLYTVGSNNYGQIGDSGASAFAGPKEMSTDFDTYTITNFTYPGENPNNVTTIIDTDGDDTIFETDDSMSFIVYPEYNIYPHLLSVTVDGEVIAVSNITNIGGRIIIDVPNIYSPGEVTITLDGFTLSDGTYVDADGDTTHDLTILEDTTPPTFTVSNQITEGGTDYYIDWVSVATSIADNASDEFIITQTIDYDLGTYLSGTVTLRVTDEAENYTEHTFNVTVVDTTAPTFTVPEMIILETGTLIGYDWTDMITEVNDVGRDPVDMTLTEVNDPVVYDYPTTISYDVSVRATDPEGNYTTKIIEVYITDTEAPIFDTIVDQTINVSETDIDWTTFILNPYELSSSVLTMNEDSDLVEYGVTGTYSVTVSLTDESDNKYTQTFNVEVIDSELPIIAYTGDTSIEVNTGSIDFFDFITVTDNYDLNLEELTEMISDVVFDMVGSYQIVFTVTDSSDNIGSLTVDIDIVDTTSPLITIIGEENIIIEYGETYTDDGVLCTDNYDNDCDLIVVNSIDFTTAGEYTITYNAIDASDNQAIEIVRTITINEPDRPVVTLNPSVDTIYVGGCHNDASVTIADDMYDTSPRLDVVSNVDTNTVGVYLITYTVTNEVGITKVVKRYVTVVELDPVVIFDIEKTNTSIEVNDAFEVPSCTAQENNESFVCESTNNVNTSISGIYTVEYTVLIDDQTYTYTIYVFVYTKSEELVLFFDDKKEGVIV